MIQCATSDQDVELWFARHHAELLDATVHQILDVINWMTIIGIPANDRILAHHNHKTLLKNLADDQMPTGGHPRPRAPKMHIVT